MFRSKTKEEREREYEEHRARMEHRVRSIGSGLGFIGNLLTGLTLPWIFIFGLGYLATLDDSAQLGLLDYGLMIVVTLIGLTAVLWVLDLCLTALTMGLRKVGDWLGVEDYD